MTQSNVFSLRLPVVAGSLLAVCCFSVAQAQTPPRQRDQLREPVYRVANTPQTPQQQEHPLAPALRIAEDGYAHIRKDIRDYSCTLVKRERVGNKLMDHEYIYTKVRHERTEGDKAVAPFSVYMYFVGPDAIKGRECLYVKGQNNGKMLAHEAKGVKALAGSVWLNPDGPLAMMGQRYPITEVGLENLTFRLIERAKQDMQFGECEVQFFKGAKINGRVCTCIQVTHPVRRANFDFYQARVFIDDELQIPVRYEAYSWPSVEGGKPELLEEYTYLNVKLNEGFTDLDFDRNNPKYNF